VGFAFGDTVNKRLVQTVNLILGPKLLLQQASHQTDDVSLLLGQLNAFGFDLSIEIAINATGAALKLLEVTERVNLKWTDL
jgi:hypothetical protein